MSCHWINVLSLDRCLVVGCYSGRTLGRAWARAPSKTSWARARALSYGWELKKTKKRIPENITCPKTTI